MKPIVKRRGRDVYLHIWEEHHNSCGVVILELSGCSNHVSPLWLRILPAWDFYEFLPSSLATESWVKLSSPTYWTMGSQNCCFGDPKKEPYYIYYTQSNPSCLEGPMTWFLELITCCMILFQSNFQRSSCSHHRHFDPTCSKPRGRLKGSEANLVSGVTSKKRRTPPWHSGKKTYIFLLWPCQSCEEGSFTGCFHLLYWLESVVSSNSFKNMCRLAHTCFSTFWLMLVFKIATFPAAELSSDRPRSESQEMLNDPEVSCVQKICVYIFMNTVLIHANRICSTKVTRRYKMPRYICFPFKNHGSNELLRAS